MAHLFVAELAGPLHLVDRLRRPAPGAHPAK
jgi:hypothetical protein